MDQFIFITLALLLEHSVVFVSENISLLTATVLLFSSALIKPFEWNNPLIFNCPEALL
jgi:hypothetical protein